MGRLGYNQGMRIIDRNDRVVTKCPSCGYAEFVTSNDIGATGECGQCGLAYTIPGTASGREVAQPGRMRNDSGSGHKIESISVPMQRSGSRDGNSVKNILLAISLAFLCYCLYLFVKMHYLESDLEHAQKATADALEGDYKKALRSADGIDDESHRKIIKSCIRDMQNCPGYENP